MVMQRTITVKGTGRLSAKPDYVTISMDLSNIDKDYENVMKSAAFDLQQVKDCLVKVGFDKEDVKTTNFDVQTAYDSKKDIHGNYKRVFKGFEYTQNIKIEFDFNNKLLTKTIVALAECQSRPEFRIKFTVKDPTSVCDELLRNATVNAKRKAEILCDAADAKLGKLITINYNWGEIDFISKTDYSLSDDCMMMEKSCMPDMDFTPDDIDVSDTVTFVWEIL
jgi:hypothetical protein